MPRETSPAFQFYPQDFLSDTKVSAMNATACGVYIRLLCHCWLDRVIPNDPQALARLGGYTGKNWSVIWGQVKSCFSPVQGGYIQPRIERERSKQVEYRELKRKAGLASAQQRANSASTDIATESNPPSSSSSSSSISGLKEQANTTVSERPNGNGNGAYVSDYVNGTTDPELAKRAGRFCEKYAALYSEHRKGARYLPKPARDWPKAVELCQTWDDGRLEKIAIVFLKTDHQFAMSGSRTIGQFAALASWCDDRLREVESGGR